MKIIYFFSFLIKWSASKAVSDDYDYNAYHTFDEIYEWASTISRSPTRNIKMESIGKSWENRDLFVLVLKEATGLENPKRIFIDCRVGNPAKNW